MRVCRGPRPCVGLSHSAPTAQLRSWFFSLPPRWRFAFNVSSPLLPAEEKLTWRRPERKVEWGETEPTISRHVGRTGSSRRRHPAVRTEDRREGLPPTGTQPCLCPRAGAQATWAGALGSSKCSELLWKKRHHLLCTSAAISYSSIF